VVAKADIVWPTHLDPWLKNILADLVKDEKCLRALAEKALIRVNQGASTPLFSCIEKTIAD
jgi:hypothetical protein